MSLTRTLIYLSGRRNNAGTQILLPLPSAAVLFLVHYCDCNLFELVFVDEETSASECVSVSFAALLATKHTFTDKHSCLYRCDLPVVCDDPVIRSGLCSTLRCLIKKCHTNNPEKNLHDLLVSKYLFTSYYILCNYQYLLHLLYRTLIFVCSYRMKWIQNSLMVEFAIWVNVLWLKGKSLHENSKTKIYNGQK